jgi:hypothetical protein
MNQLTSKDEVGILTLDRRIMHRGRNSKGRAAWECTCKCGNKVVRREDYLLSGRAVSCGCTNAGQWKTGSECRHWNGCGEISGQFWCCIKKSAQKRDIEFNISIEEAWQKFLEQDKKCALTNLPLQFYGLRDRERGFQQTASLDRINALHGYVINNVQWVHKDVNMMKKEYSQERFIEICRLVTEYERSKQGKD